MLCEHHGFVGLFHTSNIHYLDSKVKGRIVTSYDKTQAATKPLPKIRQHNQHRNTAPA